MLLAPYFNSCTITQRHGSEVNTPLLLVRSRARFLVGKPTILSTCYHTNDRVVVFKAFHPRCVLTTIRYIVLSSLNTTVYLLHKTAICFGYTV
jgi:hypothetical protein